MATTTIADAMTALGTLLKTLVGVSPGGTAAPIRYAVWGNGSPMDEEIPHLSFSTVNGTRKESSAGNYTWTFVVKFRIVSEVSGADGDYWISDASAYVALIADTIDSWTKPDGVSGLEEFDFSVVAPLSASHGNLQYIEGNSKMNIEVAKGSN